METQNEKLEAMDPVILTTTSTTLEAELIMNLLRNNHIACLHKSKGIGGYMNLYMGFSIYGEEVYVDKNDYEQAVKVLDELSEPVDIGIEATEEFDRTDEVDETTKMVNPLDAFYIRPQTIARIILGITIGIFILSFILNDLL